MNNLTDITNVTDAVLDAFMDSKAGLEPTVDHLTSNERRQLADLFGWEITPFVMNWIADEPKEKITGPDYEGMILARQERDF